MENLFVIIISAIFVNNIVLMKFLGLCPFFGVSKKTSSALGMSGAVLFVMTIASIVTWLINTYLLIPFGIEYLRTISFILIIASLVQTVEILLKRFNQTMYKALGIYLPLITTNCAILGMALLNIQENYNFIEALVFGIATGVGFGIALLVMSGIRERLEIADVPKAFQGLPIAFIVASLMSLAFLGFIGIV
jgi:electron transport complex protein RnfA